MRHRLVTRSPWHVAKTRFVTVVYKSVMVAYLLPKRPPDRTAGSPISFRKHMKMANTSTAMTYSGGVAGPTGLAVEVTDHIDCFRLFLSFDIYDELLVRPICMLINREQ